MIDPRLIRLAEERDLALGDIRELDAQVASGEIDPVRAASLRQRYEVAAANAIEQIKTFTPPSPSSARSRKRIALGVGGFVIAATVAAISLTAAVRPRPEGGFATGGVAQEALEGSPVDLSTVTNEQMEEVVAANPDIVPMRLALARRYLEDGDFSSALGHYLYVLERETNPEALMYVGWMTYLSGDAPTAAELLRRSLALAPSEPLAQWFLANVLLYGTGEPAEAIPLLTAVIASGVAPADVVASAEAMLQEAGA